MTSRTTWAPAERGHRVRLLRGGATAQAAPHAATAPRPPPRPPYGRQSAPSGTRSSPTDLKPGDLVFTHGYGRVQLYAGHGRVIEARPSRHPRAYRSAARLRHRRRLPPRARPGPHHRSAAMIARESGWKTTATTPTSGACLAWDFWQAHHWY